MRVTIDSDKKKFFERRAWREGRKALVKCREGVIQHSEHTDPERLRVVLPALLNSAPMTEHILNTWSRVGGRFAHDTEKKIRSLKSAIPEMELKADSKQLTLWEEKMKKYSAERTLAKVKAIMTTEQEAINRVIDSVIQEGIDEGLGIMEIRKLLTHDLSGEQMLELENWQAQRIALTEVGSAANTGSFEAAQENSEGVKKIWMFMPGLKTFREEHQAFEALGPQDMDYDYDTVNGGLQYPGDPQGTAEQVINCYCTIGYDVDSQYN